jgi:hypothetical protein
MRDNEFTKILGWPGYRVYRHEIDEAAKTLHLWVRRKRGNRKLICSGCGRKFSEALLVSPTVEGVHHGAEGARIFTTARCILLWGKKEKSGWRCGAWTLAFCSTR